MENTKFMKSAAVIDRILKVLQGLSCASVIVSAVFIPLTLIFGEKVIAKSSDVKIGILDVKLAGDPSAYLDSSHIKVSILAMLVGAILVAAAAWYCLRVLRQILAPMKEGTPFAAGVSGKIRKLALAVLIGGGVAEVGRLVNTIFEIRAYSLDRLLNMDAIASVSYNYSLSPWFIVTALILFFLSYVFRCGEALQRQADETL